MNWTFLLLSWDMTCFCIKIIIVFHKTHCIMTQCIMPLMSVICAVDPLVSVAESNVGSLMSGTQMRRCTCSMRLVAL